MKTILTLLSTFLFAQNVMAQSITDVSFNAEDSAATGIIKSRFVVQLSDTLHIDEVEVKIGSNAGLNDVLNQTFVFDQSGGLPNGLAYLREGNRVILETGSINNFPTYFGRVRLKLSGGQYTAYFDFTSN